VTADDQGSFRRGLDALDARFSQTDGSAGAQPWLFTTFRLSSDDVVDAVERTLISAGYAVSRVPAEVSAGPRLKVMHLARSLFEVRGLISAEDPSMRQEP
jgi:hypothetical protein